MLLYVMSLSEIPLNCTNVDKYYWCDGGLQCYRAALAGGRDQATKQWQHTAAAATNHQPTSGRLHNLRPDQTRHNKYP